MLQKQTVMKNKNKKPNKPTEPFGSVAFGKNGSVRKHITNLSSDKQTQENEVITLFLEGIQRIKQLPEAGQDFLLDTPLGEITIELTEIVDREFTFKPSDKPYRSGGFDFHVLKQGELWPVDRMGLCIALQKSIEKKI